MGFKESRYKKKFRIPRMCMVNLVFGLFVLRNVSYVSFCFKIHR